MNDRLWKKDFGPHHLSERDFLLISVVGLIFIGLFIKVSMLYYLIGMFLVFLVINYIYDYSIGNRLFLESKRQTIRMFQGEQKELSLELDNHSFLPFIHGQLRIQIEPILESLAEHKYTGEGLHAFQRSFTLRPKAKAVIQFPFEAKARGVAKVRNISYTFPHLFNFNMVTLFYIPYYFTEVVVFPEPVDVEGVETAFQISPDEHRVNLSPFEDVQSPIQTRNYEYSDPFYRINWKASAKAQQLQTNIYEKIVDTSYVFIINVRHLRNGIQVNKEMEKVLSYATFICQHALEANASYELYINAHTFTGAPYLHLIEGQGRIQYAQALEMLARIPRNTMTFPLNNMIHSVKKQVVSPKTIVIIGEVPDDSVSFLREWSVRQQDIFHVVPNENGAVMERWNGEVRLHA